MNGIRNITVSGRIATGATTLAKQLADELGWKFLEGSGYNDAFFKKIGVDEVNVRMRPDALDTQFDARVKGLLQMKDQYVIQSHLAGFDAQGIDGVYKILTLCFDSYHVDKADIRIDRLANRKEIPIEQAKYEVMEREKENLAKWRRLYAPENPSWVYWDEKYYDLVVNTYKLNKKESLMYVLKKIGYYKNYAA